MDKRSFIKTNQRVKDIMVHRRRRGGQNTSGVLCIEAKASTRAQSPHIAALPFKTNRSYILHDVSLHTPIFLLK